MNSLSQDKVNKLLSLTASRHKQRGKATNRIKHNNELNTDIDELCAILEEQKQENILL